jgi:hypothetical protein
MTPREWKMGDRLIHTGRPEWGVGEVRSVEGATQDGAPCQRVTLRFERAGVKVLNTAFADLRTPDEMGALSEHDAASEGSWLDKAEAGNAEERMTQLPEPATDPFRSKKARLEATLGLYRFTASAGALLDWATAQSGLKDPLSRFNRHQLEQLFERFKNNLDTHLKRLAFEMKKEDPSGLAQAIAAAPQHARPALRRLDVGR